MAPSQKETAEQDLKIKIRERSAKPSKDKVQQLASKNKRYPN